VTTKDPRTKLGTQTELGALFSFRPKVGPIAQRVIDHLNARRMTPKPPANREAHGEFDCLDCDATVLSFVETRDPPPDWRWHLARNGWTCPDCSPKDTA